MRHVSEGGVTVDDPGGQAIRRGDKGPRGSAAAEAPAADGSSEALRRPRAKVAVGIRLDADLVDWFKAEGPGYQTRINAVLRAFAEARAVGPGGGR